MTEQDSVLFYVNIKIDFDPSFMGMARHAVPDTLLLIA
jgi:hypothetical protein